MPEPPLPETVALAVLDLILLGALDENEMLTPLGRRIAMFTTHPKLSKALVHAAIFRYLYLKFWLKIVMICCNNYFKV
jgi:ATP-dependent RNA helicase DHX30